MKTYLNTHVPVYDENNVFVEMLSESTIAYWIAYQIDKHGKVRLDSVKVGDVPLENSNDFFVFVDKEKSIYDIEHLFATNFKEHKRLGAVFVTEHGTPNEPIEGILTAMDLPALSEHFIL
ncbi:MAG: CBS domain-containing protein [Candidatus Peribacteria bacterium]|nr:MAG: CBS domain-containing protein [Candidatus Peribacteria bacterium]